MSSLEIACREPDSALAAGGGPACSETSFYPRFVCRVAGLPVGVLEEMRAADTAGGLDEVAELERRLEESKDSLADALYEAIGGLDDRRLRRRLLAIRRDVHNGRALDAATLTAAAPALPPDLHRDLELHRALEERRSERLTALAAVYETELSEARRRLQAAAGEPDFANGLLLSSRPLYSGLERYRRTEVGRFGAKERQLERGLLRYLSRMAMKTSPFATFTAIVPGRFTHGRGRDSGRLAFSGDPRAKRSVVRLNKRIFAVLREELFADEEVRPHLPVELNPTLQPEGGQWLFLAAAAGDREIFRRVPRNPVLDLFAELLAGGPVALGELQRRVAERPELDASPEEVAAYVGRLIEIGLLRFRLGIGEQEADWDRPLAELLRPASGTGAAAARRLLGQLRSGRDEFERAPVERRRELLEETAEVMRATCARLLQRTAMPTDIPFYEDCAGEAALDLPWREVAPAAADLAEWTRLTARLAWPRNELAAMRHFFDAYYGGTQSAVPLLRFYEDYHREHLKEQLEIQQAQRRGAHPAPAQGDDDGGDEEREHDEAAAAVDPGNPFGLEIVTAIKAATEAMRGLIGERWRDAPDAEEIELTAADLERIVAAVPEPGHPCHSSSAFVQLLPGCGRGGGTALLGGTLLRGFGKYFSRFLHLLPEELRDDLAAHNDTLTDELLAEISADGAFNANLHPPLLRWEIGYPTGDGSGAHGRLSASDLVVEPRPGDADSLALRHRPSGRRVAAIDLGFQNPSMRPPLFQLLSRFAPACNFSPQLPQHPAPGPTGESPAPPAGITHRPRLRFGDLFLSRRRWSVPGALFPRLAPGETEWEHFQRVQRWRRENGIPREVFMSLYPAAQQPPPAAAAEAGEAGPPPPRREHPHKPQYIDFDNPLLVDLFGRSLESLDGFDAYLYERLPAREHLIAAGGDPEELYVAELVVQVDLRRELPGAGAEEGAG